MNGIMYTSNYAKLKNEAPITKKKFLVNENRKHSPYSHYLQHIQFL